MEFWSVGYKTLRFALVLPGLACNGCFFEDWIEVIRYIFPLHWESEICGNILSDKR